MVYDIERGVSIGVWKLMQNTDTKEVVLTKYGHTVKNWKLDKLLKEDEMQNMLLRESYKGE